MEPEAFADMTDGIRAAEILRRADVDKNAIAPFTEMRRVFQKSVVSIGAISRGTTITREMLGIKKPGTGLPPARLETLVGRRALADIPADSVIRPAWVGLDESEAQSRE
jgi:N-acetylneuraminate synthase